MFDGRALWRYTTGLPPKLIPTSGMHFDTNNGVGVAETLCRVSKYYTFHKITIVGCVKSIFPKKAINTTENLKLQDELLLSSIHEPLITEQ